MIRHHALAPVTEPPQRIRPAERPLRLISRLNPLGRLARKGQVDLGPARLGPAFVQQAGLRRNGQRKVGAARIREKAAEAGIPIHRDPPTARALFATVDIGQEIRPEHYRAVAAAIRFAEAMRKKAKVSR